MGHPRIGTDWYFVGGLALWFVSSALLERDEFSLN